jgi:type II secretory pathway pseudopilin PulG
MLKINVTRIMEKDRRAFTFIEMVMIIVTLGIMAALVIPKFIDLRNKAEEARAEANIGAMRAAVLAYYSKTALPKFQSLCTSAGNSYRRINVPNPCYPASYQEIESLLASPPNWGSDNTGGACYNSSTGQVSSCQ